MLGGALGKRKIAMRKEKERRRASRVTWKKTVSSLPGLSRIGNRSTLKKGKEKRAR